MISQSHRRPRSLGLAGWWFAVVLGVLGSFVTPVVLRAGHVHTHAKAPQAEHRSHAGSGCGHHHHDGVDNPTEPEHSDEDGPCDVCLKLTLAAFTSMVGGSTVGLVLPRSEAVTVDVDAPWSVRLVSVWRATSRGPPALV